MSRVRIDSALRSKLLDFNVPLEFCNESGKVIAYLTLANTQQNTTFYEQPELAEEEIARRLAEPDFSTAEVLDYLRKL